MVAALGASLINASSPNDWPVPRETTSMNHCNPSSTSNSWSFRTYSSFRLSAFIRSCWTSFWPEMRKLRLFLVSYLLSYPFNWKLRPLFGAVFSSAGQQASLSYSVVDSWDYNPSRRAYFLAAVLASSICYRLATLSFVYLVSNSSTHFVSSLY